MWYQVKPIFLKTFILKTNGCTSKCKCVNVNVISSWDIRMRICIVQWIMKFSIIEQKCFSSCYCSTFKSRSIPLQNKHFCYMDILTSCSYKSKTKSLKWHVVDDNFTDFVVEMVKIVLKSNQKFQEYFQMHVCRTLLHLSKSPRGIS